MSPVLSLRADVIEVLLIDDMPGVRRAVSAVLKQAGHTVTTACDGEEAIHHLRLQRFDVVITDLMMPLRDGAEVVSYIKAMVPRPIVIVITGSGAGTSPETALYEARFEADAFLDKPFEGAELNALIELLLAKPH